MKTLQHIINIKEKVSIPLFEELGNTENKVEFLVCKFDTRYDGLIGNNILGKLNAIVNFKENILEIDGKRIPLKHALVDVA